jgi:diaminopimelate epimerase
VRTGAGIKTLRLLRRRDLAFEFEMNMGRPEITAATLPLELSYGPRDVTLLWVGNPQCAVPVEHFDFDWRSLGAQIEKHPHFPKRTNVSFVKRVDEHTIDVRFWERGAGETMSSGTGSTGAAAMAVVALAGGGSGGGVAVAGRPSSSASVCSGRQSGRPSRQTRVSRSRRPSRRRSSSAAVLSGPCRSRAASA